MNHGGRRANAGRKSTGRVQVSLWLDAGLAGILRQSGKAAALVEARFADLISPPGNQDDGGEGHYLADVLDAPNPATRAWSALGPEQRAALRAMAAHVGVDAVRIKYLIVGDIERPGRNPARNFGDLARRIGKALKAEARRAG